MVVVLIVGVAVVIIMVAVVGLAVVVYSGSGVSTVQYSV